MGIHGDTNWICCNWDVFFETVGWWSLRCWRLLDQAIPSGLARLKGRHSPAIGRLSAFHRLHSGRNFGSVRRQFSYHICFDSNHGLRCQSLHVAFSVHGDGKNPMIGDDVYRPFLVTLVVDGFQVGSTIIKLYISVACIVMHCFWQVWHGMASMWDGVALPASPKLPWQPRFR